MLFYFHLPHWRSTSSRSLMMGGLSALLCEGSLAPGLYSMQDLVLDPSTHVRISGHECSHVVQPVTVKCRGLNSDPVLAVVRAQESR